MHAHFSGLRDEHVAYRGANLLEETVVTEPARDNNTGPQHVRRSPVYLRYVAFPRTRELDSKR